jgi:hypothetical protein
MAGLVALSAARARRRYGLVYPRDAGWIRAGSRVGNAILRLFRRRLRFYVHPAAEVEQLVRAAGLEAAFRRTTTIWQVIVFERT